MNVSTFRRVVIACLCFFGIYGCDTSYQYVPPGNLTPQSAATITGSKLEMPGLSGDVRVYLVAIDGKLTLDGPNGWDDRALAAPGSHVIRFGIAQGSPLTLGPKYGGIGGQIQATLLGAKVYSLRASAPVPGGGGGQCVVSWMEDEQGRLASDKVTVKIARSGGEVAASIGGGVAVPIHIPGGDINEVACLS